MANFNNIKHEIDQNVNTNGVQAITGAILNETLKDMIDEVDDKKQDTLVAGSGIAINGNVISATGGGGGQEYYAGNGIDIDQNNVISTDLSDIAGNGLVVGTRDGVPVLEVNTGSIQQKLTAGQNITISSSNVISAADTTYSAGQGLELNGTTFSVDYDEVQEKLESGQNIKTVNGYSLLGSGDIVIQGGGGGNYLPLEGGTLQNTAPGEDTELKVIDGMDEDYVKIVAPESQGEAPHIEIFENGSGDTKIYYDHIERGSQVSIDLPSSSGTLALTSDLDDYLPLTGGTLMSDTGSTTRVLVESPNQYAIAAIQTVDTGSGGSPESMAELTLTDYDSNANNHSATYKSTGIGVDGNLNLEFPTGRSGSETIATLNDLAGKQDTLVAGQNITIQNNVISATGGSGQSYVAGSGIDITGNTISVDNTVATTSDLAGYLPLTGGNLQASSIATEVRVKSPSDDSYVYLHAVDSGSPDVKLHRDIQNPTNGEVHEIDIKQDRIDIERWDQSGNTWMADSLYFPQFKTGTIALTSDLAGKQDTLTAGTGISIQNNVISATGGGGGTAYTAGPGIEIAQNNEIYVKQGSGLGFDQNDNLLVDWSSLPTGNGLVYSTDPVDPSISYIEVDTNTIQEKLVAGSNITINGNVISASGGGSGTGLWVNGTGTNSLLSPAAQANNSDATGTASVAGGKGSVLGNYSVAFGEAVIGNQSYPNSSHSFAAGAAKVYGSGTVGIGSVEIWGDGSVALGNSSTVMNADHAVALNAEGISSDYGFSAAGGYAGAGNPHTLAPWYQVSIGHYTKTYNESEVALGCKNKSSHGNTDATKTFFSIGDSRSNVESNVFEIMRNDDLYVKSVGGYDGTNASAAGIKTLQTVLNGKQDQLTAGTGISIQNNVISATGGSGASYTAGPGITIDQNNEISANPDGINIVLDSNDQLSLDFAGVAGNLQGTGLQVDSNTGATLEVDFSQIPSQIAGNGLQDSGNGTLEIDTTTIVSDLSGSFLPLEGGALQQTDTNYPSTDLGVYSPDNASFGYINSYSEDTTSDPQNPVPAFVELGLVGQPSGSTDATLDTYFRSNGTIAIDYLDSQGNSEMVELEFPRKAAGQTYTIATLDDIQGGGGSYVAGNGIDITGSTISVDTTYLDGEYLPLSGGTLSEDPNNSATTRLTVMSPDNYAVANIETVDLDPGNTPESMAKLTLTDYDSSNNPHTAIFETSGISDGTYKISFPTLTQDDTFALLSDIQGGGGSSYTAGTGIDITNNVISNLAPGLWTSGTGTDSLMTPTAVSSSSATASGNGSISTGNSTKATGQYSFAGGQTSTATGNSTFSYGRGTKTNSEGETAIGKYNSSHAYSSASPYNTRFSVGNGSSTINTKNSFEIRDNDKVFVYGLGGYIGNGNDTTSLSLQEVINNKQDALTAGSGISIVNNVISATGGGGSSLWTNGTGTDSLVAPATVSSSLSQDPAAGDGAISCGYDTNADGDYAFAQGGASSASGDYSFAANNGTAGGDYSAAFGTSGANGDRSFAAGDGSIADAAYSVALSGGAAIYDESDPDNIINAEYGVAIGTGSTVETANSLAMMGGTASAQNGGSHSVAIGDGATADGMYDVALTGSTSSGNYSFAASTGIAIGHYSTGLSGGEGNGEGSIASGFGSVAFGFNSAALGLGLMTYDQADGTDYADPNAGEAALGRYNYSEQDIIFSIGCGHYEPPVDPTDPADVGTEVRENAITITNDGSIFIKGLGGYTGTSVSGCTSLQDFLNNL